MKKFLLYLCGIAVPFLSQANGISDSLHVKHYSIHLDTLNYSATTFKAHTIVTFEAKKNDITRVNLELLKLNVDSIVYNTQKLTYSYNDTLLGINLPVVVDTGDSVKVTVYYHGKPTADPVFGGFSFSGTYAYNIGVGFQANPHNLGKCWFPCIDEFTDRATYDFHIYAPTGYKGFSNGLLTSITPVAGGNIFNWDFAENIPTYLAAVAVAPFVTLNHTYKNIPVQWGCLAADSSKTKVTFAKIDTAMRCFINAYGPYPWEKAGFIMVPFNGGAMEHASSIHVGKVFIDGTLTYETMWAHELSHMWWGDKVTCETAGDMWLNEGFATFNEALFTEAAYGNTAYKSWIRNNHRTVVQLAHIQDASYLSLQNVPHDYTYGTTVYKKGGDIVHTLRNYMGDADFFAGCKYYMNSKAYGNGNSYDLRDALSTSSGKDLTTFFNDWVFTPGFPQFSIDSVVSIPVGYDFSVTVYTHQKQRGNNHIYAMPVECTFTDGTNSQTKVVNINATTNNATFLLPFKPLWTALDRNEKISDAITDFETTISSVSKVSFAGTDVTLDVKSAGTGPNTIRIEDNWVAPDPFKFNPKGISISDYHYWKIDGLFSPGFFSKAIFTYNGTKPISNSSGFIDDQLIKKSEDSLAMFYRISPADDWHYVKQLRSTGTNHNDKLGSITIDTLRKGEYVLVNKVSSLGISAPAKKAHSLNVFPNPSLIDQEYCTVDFGGLNSNGTLQMFDVTGRVLKTLDIEKTQTSMKIDLKDIGAGMYFFSLLCENQKIADCKYVISK